MVRPLGKVTAEAPLTAVRCASRLPATKRPLVSPVTVAPLGRITREVAVVRTMPLVIVSWLFTVTLLGTVTSGVPAVLLIIRLCTLPPPRSSAWALVPVSCRVPVPGVTVAVLTTFPFTSMVPAVPRFRLPEALLVTLPSTRTVLPSLVMEPLLVLVRLPGTYNVAPPVKVICAPLLYTSCASARLLKNTRPSKAVGKSSEENCFITGKRLAGAGEGLKQTKIQSYSRPRHSINMSCPSNGMPTRSVQTDDKTILNYHKKAVSNLKRVANARKMGTNDIGHEKGPCHDTGLLLQSFNVSGYFPSFRVRPAPMVVAPATGPPTTLPAVTSSRTGVAGRQYSPAVVPVVRAVRPVP